MRLQRLLLAATAAATLFGINAFAQDQPFVGTVSVLAVPAGAITVDAKDTSGFNITAVVAGATKTGIPCVNCVLGTTSGTVGVTLPVYEVTHSTAVTFTVIAHSSSYVGACSVTGTFKVGLSTTTLPPVTITGGCVANTVYVVAWNGTLGSKTGSATLTGSITDTLGTFTQKMSMQVN